MNLGRVPNTRTMSRAASLLDIQHLNRTKHGQTTVGWQPLRRPSQFRAMPSNFPSCPCTVSWLGRVAPLGSNSPLPILRQRHPRASHCLRAYQLPKHWGVPSLATPPQCPRGVLAPRVPFRGSPVPSTLPPWHTAPRAPHQRVTRAHYLSRPPHGLLAYHGRLARCPVPGVPTQRYSPFVATLPTRQQGSCTPPNGFRAYIPTNSKTTSILSI